MRKHIKTLGILAAASLLLAGCEKNIEHRSKLERGRGKMTLAEEMAEFENYSKHHDKLAKVEHVRDQQEERKDRRRARNTKKGMDNGTLLEEYGKLGSSGN